MKDYRKYLDEMDPGVIPLVEYFNSVGLPTTLSCQGHNDTNLSLFWIEFDESVGREQIVEFQRKHFRQGVFCCCGHFGSRLLVDIAGRHEMYEYVVGSVKAAMLDLARWKYEDTLDDKERYNLPNTWEPEVE